MTPQFMDTLFANLDFDHPIWQGLMLALLIGITLALLWSPMKKVLAHRHLQNLIGKLGHMALRHISLMDGADVPIYIEHLVLRPEGFLVLIIKLFPGNIFAADKIQNWTQVIGHHSFKFTNPLHELEVGLQTLRGMFPKIPVKGLVIFAQGANFPKGKPDLVCNFEELKAMASQQDKREIPESVQTAWDSLTSSVQTNKQLHPAVFYQRGDKKRFLFGIVLFVFCLIYIAEISGLLKGLY